MGLDLTKLEKVKNSGDHIIARCPACAELGNDRKGNHLCIYPDGRFSCVIYPSNEGQDHRKRIFELAGLKKHHAGFKINQFSQIVNQPIIKNVLGRLGQDILTSTGKVNKIKEKNDSKDTPPPSVPSVPETFKRYFSDKLGLHYEIKAGSIHFEDGVIYTDDEMKKLKGIDDESLQKAHQIKKLFNGKVVQVTEKVTN